MEPHNVDIVTFSEMIRMQMLLNKLPLIRRRRRHFYRTYDNVFVGREAVAWAKQFFFTSDAGTDSSSCKDDKQSETISRSTQNSQHQAINLYKKLMDAGMIRNVLTMEGFNNDNSLYRFSSDAEDTDQLVQSVAFGFRMFLSGQCSTSSLFQKIRAFGELVFTECMKSFDIIACLLCIGISATTDEAVLVARRMLENDVLKAVDPAVTEFTECGAFYTFAVNYSRPVLTVDQFLIGSFAYGSSNPGTNNTPSSLRDQRIQLRRISESLMDGNDSTFQESNFPHYLRKKGLSACSDDSGFDENGFNSTVSYHSLLNPDGSITKEALSHPAAPFTKTTLLINPDRLGYGFVIRGSGPCFVKVVDPDSPAGKAGLKVSQYITDVNGVDVTGWQHTKIEDFIVFGPKRVKIIVMQSRDADTANQSNKNFNKLTSPTQRNHSASITSSTSDSQSLLEGKDSDSYQSFFPENFLFSELCDVTIDSV